MKFKNFIFDLDGTLVHSFPGIAYSAESAIRAVFPDRAIPELIPHIGPPIREVFRKVLEEDSPEVLNQLEASFRGKYDSDGWIQSYAYPGVSLGLASVRDSGGTCHVLTNKPRKPTECILSHLGLLDFFRSIVTPDARQPHFRTKEEAAIALKDINGLIPEETVLIGDSADDAIAAVACGFSFAAVDYGYGNVASKGIHRFDYRLTCFQDLISLLA